MSDVSNTPLTQRLQTLITDAFSDFFEVPGQWKVDLKNWLELDSPQIHSSAIVGLTEGVVTANIEIENFGTSITTGVKGDIKLERDFRIIGWSLLANASGDIVVDIWKDTLGNYPPTVADKITASSPPSLIGQDHASDTGLVGWTTDVNAGETLRFNVASVSGINRVCLALALRPR